MSILLEFSKGFFIFNHLGVFLYVKRNFHFLRDKQQCKCPQKFTVSSTGGYLLGTIWRVLLACILWVWFFCFSPGAAEPFMLDFVHSCPEAQGQKQDVVQLTSCPCQLSAKGKVKCINPLLLTFNHVSGCSCLHGILCSLVNPLIFTWHQEKCDTMIFFVVWD